MPEKKKKNRPQKKNKDYSLMNKAEYDVMYNIEDNYWWYRALHHMISRLIDKNLRGKDPKSAAILDCGCGTGGMLADVRKRYPKATGFDLSGDAVTFCHSRGFKDVKKMAVTDIKYKDGTFDIVYSLDVLCNLNLKDFAKSLSEIKKVMKDDGVFIFNLPAFDSMQSEHDRAVGIFRRFRRPHLRKELEKAGFHVEKLNYRITSLFPLIWLIRMLKKNSKAKGEEAHSDLKPMPAIINSILTGLFKLENVILTYIPAPFGLSVFGIAQKKS